MGFRWPCAWCRPQGVAIADFMEVLRPSAVYAPTYDKKLERMLDQHYDNPNQYGAVAKTWAYSCKPASRPA